MLSLVPRPLIEGLVSIACACVDFSCEWTFTCTLSELKIIFEHGWSFVQSMYILSGHHSILVGHRGVVAIIGVAF